MSATSESGSGGAEARRFQSGCSASRSASMPSSSRVPRTRREGCPAMRSISARRTARSSALPSRDQRVPRTPRSEPSYGTQRTSSRTKASIAATSPPNRATAATAYRSKAAAPYASASAPGVATCGPRLAVNEIGPPAIAVTTGAPTLPATSAATQRCSPGATRPSAHTASPPWNAGSTSAETTDSGDSTAMASVTSLAATAPSCMTQVSKLSVPSPSAAGSDQTVRPVACAGAETPAERIRNARRAVVLKRIDILVGEPGAKS